MVQDSLDIGIPGAKGARKMKTPTSPKGLNLHKAMAMGAMPSMYGGMETRSAPPSPKKRSRPAFEDSVFDDDQGLKEGSKADKKADKKQMLVMKITTAKAVNKPKPITTAKAVNKPKPMNKAKAVNKPKAVIKAKPMNKAKAVIKAKPMNKAKAVIKAKAK